MPNIHHYPIRLLPNAARVVIRPFHLGAEPRSLHPLQKSRASRIVHSVSNMNLRQCVAELSLVNRDFEARHWQTKKVYLDRYTQVMVDLGLSLDLADPQKELIGAFFCHEYSYCAAALMNPSIVPHPDQSGLAQGELRFILSLRAVGEGHISSIAFREGILGGDGSMSLLPEPPFAIAAEAIDPAPPKVPVDSVTVRRQEDSSLSGTVLFPFTPAQRNGLEDLRLVRFHEGDSDAIYYGTYTAYSGVSIAPEILSTRDFSKFELQKLDGSAAQNKGMALFPRKIGGTYAMVGRQDGENLFFLQSETILHWERGARIIEPKYPWEWVQIGNCGPPIELVEGWLLLMHGVGAMRQYSVGVALLDKSDPHRVIARSRHPVLSPSTETREGYVPNVIYSCGALAHGRTLFLPYGVADTSVAFCRIEIDELLSELS